MALRGHEEHGFDAGLHARVHARHLELVVEVADRAQAAHDHRGTAVLGETHEESFDRAHVDRRQAVVPGQPGKLAAQHLDALVEAEERPLAGVDRDSDDEQAEPSDGPSG